MAKKKVESKPAASAPKGRKPTKKEVHEQTWGLDNLASATGGFLQECMDLMQVEYGSSDICVAGEAGRIVIGIPGPSLAFEYLIQNTVLPLGRLIQVVGKEGSCKSAFCFELVRWCRQRCKGLGILFENEHKYSPDYAMSIIGHHDINALGHVPCEDLEDWQSKIQYWMGAAKSKMTGTKENPGSGRIWPAVIILDSVMGTLSRDTNKSIASTGYADRAFPLEAMKITQFFKKMPADMERWPFLFVCVNHLKDKQASGGHGPPGRQKPGGSHLSFAETFEFQLNRLTLKPQKKARWTELPINIELHKNSLGENRRSIDVNIKYWYDREEGKGPMRQYTVWDWHEATINLLLTLDEPGMRAAIRSIVDLKPVNTQAGKMITSKALGITEPVSFHDAGAILHKTKEVRDALRDLFGIKVRKRFQPTTDYLQQLKLTKEQAMALIEKAEMEEIPEALNAARKYAGKKTGADNADALESMSERIAVGLDEPDGPDSGQFGDGVAQGDE